MAVKIISPGALTTVQDRGRKGYLQYGICRCGVMDTDAYDAANHLVGNAGDEAVLEMTLIGCSMEFTEDCCAAAAGADMKPFVIRAGSDIKEPVPMYRTLFFSKGDKLFFGPAANGCRGYLAFKGGIDVPPVMGSRSTDIKGKIGGFRGRKLESGDILDIGSKELKTDEKSLQKPVYQDKITLRVIEGPQAECFTAKGLKTFYSSVYKLTPESDRMGMRLAGPAIETVKSSDIISDGTVFGSIQVTSAGLPIILMADRQTTGGYAKPAAVCSSDLPLLAQARPGTEIRFKKISIEEAEKCHMQK